MTSRVYKVSRKTRAEWPSFSEKMSKYMRKRKKKVQADRLLSKYRNLSQTRDHPVWRNTFLDDVRSGLPGYLVFILFKRIRFHKRFSVEERGFDLTMRNIIHELLFP